MGESTQNPQESGTIGAALGITLSEAKHLGNTHSDLTNNNEVSFLGKCALEMVNDGAESIKMTGSQTALICHFNHLRNNNPGFLSDSTRIKFSDLFKFRGLLGQGQYGMVIVVQDKFDCNVNQNCNPDTTALKIINKQRLHPEQIAVIRGESKILQTLVGVPNVVQYLNIFETEKFILIHMEHLKGK